MRLIEIKSFGDQGKVSRNTDKTINERSVYYYDPIEGKHIQIEPPESFDLDNSNSK